MKIKSLIQLLILSVFILLTSAALFKPGFFRTFDDVTTIRVVDMTTELQRGNWLHNFPVRWSGELSYEYGYPLFLFYAPLVYYVGSILVWLGGMSAIVATKWLYVFPLIIGPIFFFWAVKQKVSAVASVAALSLYSLFPYRGFNAYARGGVGESWAMAFIPAVFGSIFLLQKKHKLGGLLFSLFLAVVMTAHNLSGFQLLAILFVFGLVFEFKNKKYWLHLLLGLGISSFYLLPSFYYLKHIWVTYTEPNTGKIIESLFSIRELITTSLPIAYDQKFSGLIILILFGACTAVIYAWQREKKIQLNTIFWGVLSLILVFLLTKLSSPIWKISLPLTGILQFSWRILVVLSFTIPLFIGLAINNLKNKTVKYVLASSTILIALTFTNAFKPAEYTFFFEYSSIGSGPCATTTWEDEYLPINVKKCPGSIPGSAFEIELHNSKNEQAIDSDSNVLSNIINDKIKISADFKSELPATLVIRKYLFPGWKLLIDGVEAPIYLAKSDEGYFQSLIPAGTHQIEVFYSKTPVMWLADLITIFSLGIGILLLIATLKKSKNN